MNIYKKLIIETLPTCFLLYGPWLDNFKVTRNGDGSRLTEKRYRGEEYGANEKDKRRQVEREKNSDR